MNSKWYGIYRIVNGLTVFSDFIRMLALLNWSSYRLAELAGRDGYVSIAFHLIFSSEMWCVASFLGRCHRRRRRRCSCWYCYCWTSWHVQIGHLPIYCALCSFFLFLSIIFRFDVFCHRSFNECEHFILYLFSLSTSFYSHKTFSISWQFSRE